MRREDNIRVTRHTMLELIKEKEAKAKAIAEVKAIAAEKARRQAEKNRILGAIAELKGKVVELETQKENYTGLLGVLRQIKENTSRAGNNMKEGRQLLVEGMNTIEQNGGLVTIDKMIAENDGLVSELTAAIEEITNAINILDLQIQNCYAQIDGCYESLSSL